MKLNYILLVSIMIFIAMLGNASALGISPAKKTIEFSSVSQEFTYTAINNEKMNMNLSIYSIGELADYIFFENKNIYMAADESARDFKVKINLPSNLAPGERVGKIVIEQLISSADVGGTNVYAKFKVISNINVNVPYPEKFVDVKLDINGTESGKPLGIKATIKNLGTKNIDNLQTTFGIYEGESLLNLSDLPSTPLEIGDSVDLFMNLDTKNFSTGEYTAVAEVSYDNYVLEIGKEFNVGEEYIKILDYTKYFLAESVNKFDIDVQNEWNKKIRNAYARILVENGGVADLRSVSYDLEPREKSIIVSYWDTKGVSLGDYNSNITLLYSNKSTEEIGKLHVVSPEDYKPAAKKPSLILYIIIAVAFLILINVIILLLSKKRRVSKIRHYPRKVYK